MRYFYLPFGRKIKDKIIGGYLTGPQGIYLGSILVLFSMFFVFGGSLLMTKEVLEGGQIVDSVNVIDWLKIMLRLMLLFIYGCFMTALSFVKIEEIEFDRYLFLLLKFYVRKKTFIYRK